MKWYEGKIPDAIQQSKQNRTLFVVYVYGSDELSQKMTATWDDEEVTKCMQENGSIAVRIENTSDECKFFSHIYPVVVIPAVYFIGEGGVPLEVIGGHSEPQDFVNKIKHVEQMHTAQKASSMSQPSTNTGLQASGGKPESSPQGQTISEQEGTGASGDQAASSIPLEEKVDRAKELLKKKKEEKAQQEFEKQKEEEVKRRQLGQDLQKLKQNQQEMQMKELKDQMKKEKDEERKAKEKIREQIARDREERNARFQKEKAERDKALEDKKKEKLLEQQRAAAEEEARRSEMARIQVRFPDGSSVTQVYPSTDTLQTLNDFVSQRLGGNFSMSTTFPKRRFTDEDMCKTFVELQLAPTAVIIALPGHAGTPRQASSTVQSAGLLALILYPFVFIWNFLYSLLIGGGNSGAQQQNQTSQHSSSFTEDTPTDTHRRVYQRRNAPMSRQEGNVRRLTDMKDDDDDMTTYNGNSTQQL